MALGELRGGLRHVVELHQREAVAVELAVVDWDAEAAVRQGRRGRLPAEARIALVRGGEGLDAGLAELAGVLAVLGREVTRTLADDIEVELG